VSLRYWLITEYYLRYDDCLTAVRQFILFLQPKHKNFKILGMMILRLIWTLCLRGVKSVTDHLVGFFVFKGGDCVIE
jgi:hypothetical protein